MPLLHTRVDLTRLPGHPNTVMVLLLQVTTEQYIAVPWSFIQASGGGSYVITLSRARARLVYNIQVWFEVFQQGCRGVIHVVGVAKASQVLPSSITRPHSWHCQPLQCGLGFQGFCSTLLPQ